ncbi:pituitary tumor-transforming gene 1 protein-interacting protein-like [Amblyraja radiata]|uniref:pituitary tumor-transforming gene 1 protein-interacting protein-like n=1 Tax=Amblyraja radiata TaxID=386614 RepID=UPI001402E29E|nr:pituitary tumor-transforming gene 1 protein-interacting protein-like [Amblyraja radiata]
MRVGAVSLAVVLTCLSLSRPGAADPRTWKDCSDFTNRFCGECLENINCLWCSVDQRCMNYPVETIIPSSSVCPLKEARWAVCWVSFESLIIAMSIVVGLTLLPFVCCCCYCCCKFKCCCFCCKKKSSCPDEENLKLARRKEERRLHSEQRKFDLRERCNEIRRKYGLIQNSESSYHRLENEF